jgi:hypothetical protein
LLLILSEKEKADALFYEIATPRRAATVRPPRREAAVR